MNGCLTSIVKKSAEILAKNHAENGLDSVLSHVDDFFASEAGPIRELARNYAIQWVEANCPKAA